MQALVDHIKTPPTPLQQKGVDVSEALDAVVLKALEKSPESRFRSAGEFLAALRGTPEWNGWTLEQARAWWEQNLPVATLLASQPIFPIVAPQAGSIVSRKHSKRGQDAFAPAAPPRG